MLSDVPAALAEQSAYLENPRGRAVSEKLGKRGHDKLEPFEFRNGCETLRPLRAAPTRSPQH